MEAENEQPPADAVTANSLRLQTKTLIDADWIKGRSLRSGIGKVERRTNRVWLRVSEAEHHAAKKITHLEDGPGIGRRVAVGKIQRNRDHHCARNSLTTMYERTFPYQKIGAEWLADARIDGFSLADEPGLGKTAQALERSTDCASARRWSSARRSRAQLVREAEKFAKVPLRLHAYSFNTTFTERETETAKKSHTVRPKKRVAKTMACLIVGRITTWRTIRSGPAPCTCTLPLCGTSLVFGDTRKESCRDMFTILKAAGLFTGTYEQFVIRVLQTIDTPYGQRIVGSKNITAPESCGNRSC